VPAEEQLGAEALLELLHAGGHVRRHAVEAARRLGDAALLGDRLEDLECGQVDVSHIENSHITIIHFYARETSGRLGAWRR
jgi:hypothetical protein